MRSGSTSRVDIGWDGRGAWARTRDRPCIRRLLLPTELLPRAIVHPARIDKRPGFRLRSALSSSLQPDLSSLPRRILVPASQDPARKHAEAERLRCQRGRRRRKGPLGHPSILIESGAFLVGHRHDEGQLIGVERSFGVFHHDDGSGVGRTPNELREGDVAGLIRGHVRRLPPALLRWSVLPFTLPFGARRRHRGQEFRCVMSTVDAGPG